LLRVRGMLAMAVWKLEVSLKTNVKLLAILACVLDQIEKSTIAKMW
jgi:hypothetical protein